MKATWKGAPDGPDEVVLNGVKFKKGEAAEVSDPLLGRKLKGHPEFEAEGDPPKWPETPVLHVPPSQQTTPQAVPKGGEPVLAEEDRPTKPELPDPPPQNGGKAEVESKPATLVPPILPPAAPRRRI